jgi:flavodoxin
MKMKTLVLFYSFTGKTKDIAEKKAKELTADIEEILDEKKHSKFGAFLVGCPKSIMRKSWAIKPLAANLDGYEKIVILSPTWAGHPVPPVNAAIEKLPPGKKVEVVMVSSSGSTKDSTEGTKALIAAKGCEVTEYTDMRS